ncbi:hypothetical protein [Pricia sp.]|uniref:hypothetical protein n=1 Tax=Pricia sp. TaxID=2268138 RepID=UPI0035930CEA
MKTFSTLIFVLTFGAMALANTVTDVKIDSIEMGVVLGSGTDDLNAASQTTIGTENSIARLYKFQNARVKKALAFDTKHSNAKLV